MLILALDTSTAAVSAGVAALPSRHDGPATDVVVLASRVTRDARKHGEALAPQILACLSEAKISPRELSAVVAGVGPGPFTGLRVGLATAAVIADAMGCPSYSVCSLDAIAATALADTANERPLLIASDARRKEIYWALYDSAGSRVFGPAVHRPAHVRAWLDGQLELPEVPATTHRPVWMAGAGAELYARELGLSLLAGIEPGIAALVRVARARIHDTAPSQTLTPLYLRRPDAVPAPERRG